jgi:hypothetical protein
MPSDAERWRFLEENELCVTWYDNGASLAWREKRPPPGKTAGYRHLARARTLTAAIDSVIARWKRKHRVGDTESTQTSECVMLEVRGWVS